ncbi:hypothetical protein SAMN04244553_3615 [Nocardia amikacinitolerans]|uniref:Helix-turn-helix domain-containing protein n=1 Tax=Nocardia amikacinitolerans TaxID=756689 RepID=A0A285LH48_9NOCA|nr:helix-turn-helix domain-containing protein [Nocardia amikacinitolerans]SNY84298.1 hypothetical protein SAMN04244553_3615 [Nocardia amikacinitolerans]
MSRQATEWARWKIPQNLVSVAAQAVLIEFADFADANGRGAWPALYRIAWGLSCSERNVANHVKALKDAGLLVESPSQAATAHLPSDERPIVYDLPIHWVRTETYEEAKKKHNAERAARKKAAADKRKAKAKAAAGDEQNPSAPPADGYEESCRGGMKNPTGGYEESCRRGMKLTSYNPTTKPSTEPSTELPTQLPLVAAVGPVTEATHQAEIVDPYDQAYHDYPQPGGYEEGRKVFEAALEKRLVPLPMLLQAIRNFAADPVTRQRLASPERQFVPQLARWLKDRHWKQWIDPPAPALTKLDQRTLKNASRVGDPAALRALNDRLIERTTHPSVALQLESPRPTPGLGAA